MAKREQDMLNLTQRGRFNKLSKREQDLFEKNARSLRRGGIQLQIGDRGGMFFYRSSNSRRKEYIS